jgi:glucose uptake protein GlcU
MVSFDQCTDSCGWTAGIIGALAYGSFGVPIKETKDIDVHPLVLQSYKTFVMFMTCWGVVFLDVDVAFTKWGLLSGFMWVVGGTGGIYGIRMAGLAIAVGTWASIMIMVNFIFGILVFHEPVHDMWGTLGSFLLLILGLVGMSHFSASQPKDASRQSG